MTRTIYSENPVRMSECAQGGDRSANRELAGKVGRAACKKFRELSFLDIGFMVQANLTSSTTARRARFVGRRFFNDATSWSSIEQQAGVILNCPIRPHSQPPPALLLRPSFRAFCDPLLHSTPVIVFLLFSPGAVPAQAASVARSLDPMREGRGWKAMLLLCFGIDFKIFRFGAASGSRLHNFDCNSQGASCCDLFPGTLRFTP